ncbi:MAG: hypothetical protein JNK07_04845 [Alphaproteobacteria bacterium]|nr:hypothetical protein [Alphaproteobacteria bacterium]
MSDEDEGVHRTPTTGDVRLEATLTPAPAEVGSNGQGGQSGQTETRKPRDAELLRLCGDILPFHTADGEAFADVVIQDHRETFAIESPDFKNWLLHRYFMKAGRAPGDDALKSAVGTLVLRARFNGPQLSVFVRVGKHGGNIYVDLADDQRNVVEITPAGYNVVKAAPVRFVRPKLLRALPKPQPGGSIDDIRAILNVQQEHDLVLVVAWALTALNPALQCPLLGFHGEAGSAKTTAARLVRQLIDPSSAPVRAVPRDPKDIFLATSNSRVVVYDNVSRLSPQVSDLLCQIVTGGNFTTRKLYTDREEISLSGRNPIILTGIGDFIGRSDLLDRTITVTLCPIPGSQRKSESEVQAAFNEAHPRILGLLFDATAMGLNKFPNTRLAELPRMADFVLWGTACEPAFGWPQGTVASAFAANQREGVLRAVEADPLSAAILGFMRDRPTWMGTPTELLTELRKSTTADDVKSLPTNASALGQLLDRITTSLRKIGVEIARAREGKGRERKITITRWADEIHD